MTAMNPLTPVTKSVAPPPDQSQDLLFYRIVVVTLGLAVVLTVLAMFVLSMYGKTIPEGLVALGSAAAGGLVGILVPTGK